MTNYLFTKMMTMTIAFFCCGILSAQPNVAANKSLSADEGVRYVSENALADLDNDYNNGKPPVEFREYYTARNVTIIPTWIFQAKGEPYDDFANIYGRYIVADRINEAVIIAARTK